MTSTYVIQRKDGKFWVSPGRWSEEYPDAQKFENWKNAAQEALDSTPIDQGPAIVWGDYGTDAQRRVATVEPSILGEPL